MNDQRVYNVVCLLINSIGSTQKFRLYIKQYRTESVQKTAAAKRIFMPYLNLSKKLEKHNFSPLFCVG